MKRSGWLQRKTPLRSKTRIRVAGHSTTTDLKQEIQATLRMIVILRDGGCIFRNYKDDITPLYRQCGGFRKDGELILQFDHLHSRSNAVSFSDSRLGVCVCQRHHIYFKPQYPAEYENIIRKAIGKIRCELLDKVRADFKPYKVDLKLELLGLKKILSDLQ